jgi:hypothetical protein
VVLTGDTQEGFQRAKLVFDDHFVAVVGAVGGLFEDIGTPGFQFA